MSYLYSFVIVNLISRDSKRRIRNNFIIRLRKYSREKKLSKKNLKAAIFIWADEKKVGVKILKSFWSQFKNEVREEKDLRKDVSMTDSL